MMNKELLSAFGLLIGTGVLIVANGMDANPSTMFGPERQPSIALAAGADAGDRAAAMKFELYRCGAERPQETTYVPFKAASLAEFAGLEQLPVQTPGEHKFSDMNWELEEGCFFATARPIDAANQPIESCSTVRTPDTFLDHGQSQQFAMVSSCDRPGAEGIEVAGHLNHAPTIADMSVERIEDSQSCDTVRVCATARDADADQMTLHWSADAKQGRPLHLPEPERTRRGEHLTECIEVTPGKGRWEIEVTVRDQIRDKTGTQNKHRRSISYEDAYLGNWGLVAHSRDSRAVSVSADCEKAQCPENPKERITDVTYWVTRDGHLLAPTESLDGVKQGDMVDVEFEVAPGCEDTQVTFASYTGEARQSSASVFSRTYDPGHHLLWNVLPDCKFTADFHLGPPLGDDERPAADNPYGEHLIDSFAGGSSACSGEPRQ